MLEVGDGGGFDCEVEVHDRPWRREAGWSLADRKDRSLM